MLQRKGPRKKKENPGKKEPRRGEMPKDRKTQRQVEEFPTSAIDGKGKGDAVSYGGWEGAVQH